ncbi:glycosyltransferase family 2 protein [Dyella jejuensis]|uniref:Glycosyltransferase family 2 protein n=1 Tax=Dyella jejuensis TaxID=1432009 RepID=A0ABW8JLP6_9GAMM
MSHGEHPKKVAVVIPCFRVIDHVLGVISRIGPEVFRIYTVDDACPDESGEFIAKNANDPRVVVIFRPQNGGVGAATLTGYQAALKDGAEIIVKIDGDGQMDPSLIDRFIHPIAIGHADYTKGNRFFDLEGVVNMPRVRLFGNAVLSFVSKLSTGYWSVFDPTNGFTAIHANVAKRLPLGKISSRYFFETDMLFHLNVLKGVVVDVPMEAVYGDEVSNLKISKILPEFVLKHASNFFKRIFYSYFLRDMSVATFELLGGLFLFSFGALFGLVEWVRLSHRGEFATAGTVMLAGLPVMVGIQLLLAFLNFDIFATPRTPIHSLLWMDYRGATSSGVLESDNT